MHPREAELLKVLKKVGKARASELSKELNEKPDVIARIAYSLSRKGLVDLKKIEDSEYVLTEEGKDVLKHGSPERRLLDKLPAPAGDLKGRDKIALGWALKKKWVEIKNGKVVRIIDKPPVTEEEHALNDLKSASKKILDVLKKRNWIELKKRVDYVLKITEKGRKAEIEDMITQVTPKLLLSGGWKKKKVMPYSPSDPVPAIYPARFHPLTEIIEKIRRIFLDLGFTEARGNYVESAFWNFDALFVPQDHPAREMQDTFYIEGEREVPSVSGAVSKVHKKHWGGWSRKEAARMLLRTHTTVVSARMLSKLKPPAKIFTVDKVFRNETIDFKHLAEFHQVEGIVFAEDVSLKNLFGYLKHFFRKLGFEKIKIRPFYFPYTEPSAEIDVWFKPKKTWIELGGAGIFREEVVEPLTGYRYPVLAWGLGLERIAMLYYGLKDIRELYRSDISWLRSRRVYL